MPPALSIIIVNWKSKAFVRKCLKSIETHCSLANTEVVVVDGGSFDGCGEMLAAEFPRVKFIQSPQNIGFGRSNNLGFDHATGEYILLLNPDTEIKPAAIEALLTTLGADSTIGIAGPRLLNTDGSLQTSCVQALPTPLNQALDSNWLRRLMPKSALWSVSEAYKATRPTEVQAVSGACMLLRSSVFKQIGGFSPEFFMYFEDMDLCAKVRKRGLKVIHVPASEVLHHGSGSSSTQVSQFSTVMMRVAGSTYMRLNYGPWTALRYRLFQGISALVRMAMVSPTLLHPSSARREKSRKTYHKWLYVARWTLGLK